MATTTKTLLPRLGTLARTAAVTLIAGVCRWRAFSEVNEDVSGRPMAQQAAITAGVLAAVLGLSLVAASFGWIGILLFWLALIVIAN